MMFYQPDEFTDDDLDPDDHRDHERDRYAGGANPGPERKPRIVAGVVSERDHEGHRYSATRLDWGRFSAKSRHRELCEAIADRLDTWDGPDSERDPGDDWIDLFIPRWRLWAANARDALEQGAAVEWID